MSSTMLFAHNATSVVLSILCWWLAHQNSRAQPPGFIIAVGYSVAGFTLLATAFMRTAGASADVTVIITKVALIITFAAVSRRRHLMKEA